MQLDMSLSKFTKKHSVSTSKVIKHLVKKEKLTNRNSELISNAHFLSNTEINNRKILKVNEEKLKNYLSEDWEKLILCDTEKQTIGNIEDADILLERLKEVSKKKLMFLDFEFKMGNYYEMSYQIYDNHTLTDKKYVFTDDVRNSRKHEKLLEEGVHFSTCTREETNKMLAEAIKSIDYIVGHNSYCERSMLIKNGIFLKRNKFICTSNICQKINNFENEPSLSKCLDFHNIKYQNELQHFAFYDVNITKRLFDKILLG